MSMTREEAVELLCYGDWLNVISEHIGKMDTERIAEAMSIVGKALRPVSREQVEKLRGEWIPAESDFDDDDALFDVEDWCDWQCSACHNEVCYDDPMERRWLPKFCPNCGAPMTDEAVDILLKRLEALNENRD